MSLFSTEEMFVCHDCGLWWMQEVSIFGTYAENPEHVCEVCGGQGEEASEEMKAGILPEPTDYSHSGAMIEAEVMAAESEQDTDGDADAGGAESDSEAAGAEI
jgi:hypothetical protein